MQKDEQEKSLESERSIKNQGVFVIFDKIYKYLNKQQENGDKDEKNKLEKLNK